jgi:hypothetical protein
MMIVVAVVAAVMAGCIQAGRWARYTTALRDYERVRTFYGQGRVTMSRCLGESQRLMEADIDRCLTRRGQVAAITAHVRRTTRLAEEERAWLDDPHGAPDLAGLAEAELSVDACERMLRQLTVEL